MAISAAFLTLILVVTPATLVYGAVHKVDWGLSSDYSTLSSTPISVGDTLVFSYTSGQHSVLSVTKDDYSSCATSNALSSDSSGTTTIKLTKAGPMYFICGIPGHCPPMKLQIDVKDTSSSSSTGSTTATPTASGTTTTSSNTPTGSSKGNAAPLGINGLFFALSVASCVLLGLMG